ncbi:MAG: phage tail sheath subtilisin-like domain-containing protein [Desulfobacterales bacterium]
MATYLTPGIYMEEISAGTKPIAMVGTSTAAFVGVAPAARKHLDEPVAVSNWSQFTREFVEEDSPSTDLARAVFGFFNNGGSRCYVLNVGQGNPIAGDERKRTGISALETVDEAKIIAAPGYTDILSYEALISHCEKMKNRFAILEAPDQVTDLDALKKVGTAGASPSGGEEGETKKKTPAAKALRPRETNCAAFYFPWITARDPLSSGVIVRTPPSGHLAGVYARTDATRGVHKAPANEPIRGALDLCFKVTREEQGELNSAGVNCLRYFPDAGIRVWGARTLAAEAGEWRYISVRRLFNMIEESIERGTSWTVFESNDPRTWKSIERDIRAFLTLVWRDGALKGATPEQAFFVKCDEETNPPEVIDAGRLVTEIGIAPVKPAEFIIFRIFQWIGGGPEEEAGAGEAPAEASES